MTEPNHSTISVTDASTVAAMAAEPVKVSTKGLWFFIFLLVLAVIGLGGFSWFQYQTLQNSGQATAKHFTSLDRQGNSSLDMAKQAVSLAQALQDRVTELERKNEEAQSQQAALEALYQKLSQADDQRTVSEVEQILRIATQQLKLAGDVSGAIAALELAKYRLESMDRSDFRLAIQAIESDLVRLRASPNLDMVTMTRRVDELIARVDDLTLIADSVPSPKQSDTSNDSKSASIALPSNGAGHNGYWPQFKAWVGKTFDEMLVETKDLVQVQKVGTADALFLTPSQGYQLRENIKLRLLNARLSLLMRQPLVWREDLNLVERSVTNYFDPTHPASKQVLQTLTDLKDTDLGGEIPQITESVAAVHALAVSRSLSAQP